MFDREGFLRNLDDWSPQVAERIAAAEGIELGPAQWEVLELLRAYYKRFDASPAMRALVRYAGQELGADKGRSIYLLSLFPGSPAKLGCKIAGLPKPDNCL
ncbi:MAG: TusE/DsrC/DsvC family sulfur relay protein [Gammaproteobacteria bacterium]|nr:TusE/DsrC/DsvC family sulfur relay protein [Gammaproteobacteria bacterium]